MRKRLWWMCSGARMFLMLGLMAACASKGSQNASDTGSSTDGDSSDGNGTHSGNPVDENGVEKKIGYAWGPNQSYFLVGRFDLSNPNCATSSLLGSRIGVRFSGTSLALVASDTGYDSLNVYIDGAATPQVVALAPSTTPQTYPIATTLAAGEHVAWFSKRTEGWQKDKLDTSKTTGAISFYGVTLASGGTLLKPPAPKNRLIEAIGDSGCSGYGVEQISTNAAPCQYTVGTQNADQSLFAYAAQATQAEVVNTSVSGRGVYNSYWIQDVNFQLPYYYPQTVSPNPSPVWNFTSYVPDVVVVDAGGDDLFGNSGEGTFPDASAFLAAYTKLVTDIRGHYPQALIVCALAAGASGNDKITLGTPIQQVVAARKAAGDANIAYFEFFTGNPNGWTSYADAASVFGYGCEGHPSAKGAQFLGQRLGAFLQTKLGW